VTNFTLGALLLRGALEPASLSGDAADVARLPYVRLAPEIQIMSPAIVKTVVMYAPQLIRTPLLFCAESRAVLARAQHAECNHRNSAESEQQPDMQALQ
jgi:hypothetical protein